MKKNVGGVDRIFRFGVGFLCLAVFFATDDLLLKVIFGVVAVAGLLTASMGYCPINDKLTINTTAKK
jgi:dolichol kinase